MLAGVALVVAAFGFLELRYLGFPDGYLSHWDNARKGLLTGLIGVSLLMCVAAIALGWRAPSASTSKHLKIAGTLYAVALIAAVILDIYFRAQSGLGG